jgi:3-keto-5-aminohexanoate cleavage enzyme
MEKLIVVTALTGNVPTRATSPHVPLTPGEIATDARLCTDAGSSMFHVHARDPEGKPTLSAEVYLEIVRKIKKVAPEVIVMLSTGGRASKDPEARAAPVRLSPEIASITTGSNNLPGIIYENSPQLIEFLAGVFREYAVKPEIEVFEAGMINNALFLVKKGYFELPLHFNFVMGAPGAIPATVRNLLFLSESIPPGCTWSVAGLGAREIPLATAAIVMGGHARVGLEDNARMPDGSVATNPALVEKIVSIAGEVGREIATPEEARQILSMDPAIKDRILTANPG